MKTNICVYDFETDSPDPLKCNPVQLASCIIDYRTLKILDSSFFCIDIKPSTLTASNIEEYFKANEITINWHAKNYEIEPKEVLNRWINGHEEKLAFELFVSHLSKYNTKQSNKTKFSAPIRAGANIRRFDNIIMDRLCNKYGQITADGEAKIFHPRDTIDVMDFAFYWFENLREPSAYNMDSLRRFFGIPTEGAHDALKDVKDEAWMIQKFMRLHRHLSPKIPFKKAYLGQNASTNSQ